LRVFSPHFFFVKSNTAYIYIYTHTTYVAPTRVISLGTENRSGIVSIFSSHRSGEIFVVATSLATNVDNRL